MFCEIIKGLFLLETGRIKIMEKPYRVAHIIRKIRDGGVETVVNNYYKQIDKSCIQFDIYYHSDSGFAPSEELIAMGAKFYAVPPYYKNIFGYVKTLRKYFRRNSYMIVHSHMNTISFFPLYAAWREKIPIRIAHNHSVPGGRELRNIIKYILRPFVRVFATDYFACSEKAGRWLFGNSNYNKGRVQIVANAVDFSKYSLSIEKTNLMKKDFGIEGRIVIGHVGRFTYAKNHKFLLKVFKTFKNIVPNAILLLIGDGEMRNEIEKEIVALNISDDVILTGWTCQPEKYYHLIDVLVLPSFFEGIPMVLLEAQISGVPCVISDVVSREVYISNGIAALSLSASCEEWANKIKQSIQKKVVLNSKSKKYDIQKAAKILCKIYQKKIDKYFELSSKGK